MDRRRMMMSGKPRPLFVFKPGEKLQNYSEIKARSKSSTNWGSAEDYVSYKNPNVPTNSYAEVYFTIKIVRIAIPIKAGYKKLFVKARANNSGGDDYAYNYFDAYISWSAKANGENDNLTLIYDEERVFEFDISKRDKTSGAIYLFFWPPNLGNSPVTVTDIHFE